MLLSFFIILNSLSDFNEEKATKIQYSLTIAFASHEDLEYGLDPSLVDSPAQSFKEGDALENIEALFTAQITGVKVQKNRFGNRMKITLPAEELERVLMGSDNNKSSRPKAVVRDDMNGAFGSTLVSFLDIQTAIPYQMDMILHVSDKQSDEGSMTQEEKTQIHKVASYSDYLEKLGVPGRIITAGISSGEQGMVDLYFKRYEPLDFDPGKVYRSSVKEGG